MKKILAVAMITLMSAGAAFAANTDNMKGGGSKEDSYVGGQKASSPIATEDTEMRTGKHFGDGSHEDKYKPGQKDDSPMDKTVIEDNEKGSDDDGSPAE